MTIKQALIKAIQLLKEKTPHLDAELLLSHILNKPKEYFYAHGEKELSPILYKKFINLINKRADQNTPIAYLTGEKYFFGIKFKINNNVLVPRPETELMVEEALNIHNKNKHVLIADIGTGSGCIIISLAKNIKRASTKFIGVDISKSTLDVAKENGKKNKKISFLQGDLLSPVIHLMNPGLSSLRSESQDDRYKKIKTLIITANLPYLTTLQVKNSPSVQSEPKLALISGYDGLKHYKQLFTQTKQLLRFYNGKIYILCEIDPSQTTKIKKLAQNELSELKYRIKKDLSGKNRFFILTLAS
ncbi:protein-(glutamine-N5) methyltransferase, release factor-specific [Candidatus Falkowbacteria bacterium RIFOXYB2_FULL_34_18]|uniref:Protein-(Glutamine-N5) methyltransferase, release factor-specific n=1 Tax=Candidatus Falkowbacteria bacterium RIFOXYD2_FULL_34_120 TaxID=1798007 RepID=A0A1F5TNA6_9BACT|nr:MAG: protein-(glutamine-N5) methyltransferase, release factor-specific [Candidatus Falkowbacteria bacterium RIFOXYC12_FULL_34_55]OGF28836.1 MAG: protein-(glutamine-N5) methyltransferase, release factor-specific [Candidatus Falkowbacteria bacterium RIFOXYB2_FULL_34_18]OGF38388.1 MAG: protein-(glutamine-N5) methyltransferase, release factor-specific [Candidatus Falkowbacteria bacterium RIFOXYD12_FULL_34_57]OGF40378.1 MAG: protein-(glutamine-N5) methyltransferase, release factor-specific [Candid